MDNLHLKEGKGSLIAALFLDKYMKQRALLFGFPKKINDNTYTYCDYIYSIYLDKATSSLFIGLYKVGDLTAKVIYPVLDSYTDFKTVLDDFLAWRIPNANVRYFWFVYEVTIDDLLFKKTVALVYKGFPSNSIVKAVAGVNDMSEFLIINWQEFDNQKDYRDFVQYQGDFGLPSKLN